MSEAQRERSALVATLRKVGPQAPTLCEGWNTTDLAAHLVVRERRLDATLGIAVPFLADYTAKVQDKIARSTSWEALIDLVASGPPLYSPFKLLDPVANLGGQPTQHHAAHQTQLSPQWRGDGLVERSRLPPIHSPPDVLVVNEHLAEVGNRIQQFER
jgi:uncharacterized protein (TIGR03085 family)